MAASYRAPAHLMGLTFASTAYWVFGVSDGVFIQGRRFFQNHIILILIVKSLTLICEYHLNEAGRSVPISRSFAEIESLNLSDEWYRLRSIFPKILE